MLESTTTATTSLYGHTHTSFCYWFCYYGHFVICYDEAASSDPPQDIFFTYCEFGDVCYGDLDELDYACVDIRPST